MDNESNATRSVSKTVENGEKATTGGMHWFDLWTLKGLA
jgi:hypothetical protein